MKYTVSRMWKVSLFGAILLTIMSIFILENAFSNSSSPLMLNIFRANNYEYTINIPDYWEQSLDKSGHDVVFTGNNSEYLVLDIVNKDVKTYNPELYGTYKTMAITEAYGIENPELKYDKINGKITYKISFIHDDMNYIVGFIDNDTYIVDFEYKRTTKNDINAALNSIITSIEQFEVKEVTTDGETAK